ncbi:OsmC family protein [Spongiivirga citrea]|uniref:OsmC family peroxiredoxin n=1 Tax=Spongiivirga citrea TaxID=1481457 RepID=A0A6M0CH19_9FLAO|nr:OsmC family protein [Spongiivirga citrea]NER17181.1 OsmC family peroxiredoxin [Spongiivirga citrea]
MKTHHYTTNLKWTGNKGKGTASYTSYSRDYEIKANNKKTTIPGSSDPSFRGNPEHYNPEELLVASLSSCHMLWYLHLCSVNKIVVLDYIDQASGIMEETKDGSGRFTSVTLKPKIVISFESNVEKAHQLHEEANRLCFIANSCNFEILHEAEIQLSE